MAEKKYKVAKDVALTAKGVIYKPGDELPEGRKCARNRD